MLSSLVMVLQQVLLSHQHLLPLMLQRCAPCGKPLPQCVALLSQLATHVRYLHHTRNDSEGGAVRQLLMAAPQNCSWQKLRLDSRKQPLGTRAGQGTTWRDAAEAHIA
jgi:hypothetical protein